MNDQTDAELREQELQRLYRCVFYDKQDGVDREAMFIKEVGVVVDKLMAARDAEIRKVAKEENARDFSAVVKSFNEALAAGFDRPSVMRLRTVINCADARANYTNLPVQAERRESDLGRSKEENHER